MSHDLLFDMKPSSQFLSYFQASQRTKILWFYAIHHALIFKSGNQAMEAMR